MVKTVYFLLERQMCHLEDFKGGDRALPELLIESNQDLETFLSNLDSFSVGGQRIKVMKIIFESYHFLNKIAQ